jgi:hypothetical protein
MASVSEGQPEGQDKNPSTPNLPPLPRRQTVPWIPVGVVAAIVVVAVLYFLSHWLITPGSSTNDEVDSAKKQLSDYAAWTEALRHIESSGELPVTKPQVSVPDGEKKVSTWDKWFVLPRENAVRAALQRRLPKEAKLLDLVPFSYDKSDDEISVSYLVTVHLKSPLYLVPISTLHFNDPAMAKYQGLTRYVLASVDLPPGETYDDAAARQISPGRKNISFVWKVNRAAIEEGRWRIFDADPVFLQQVPDLEQKLVSASGGKALVLRTQAELDAMAPARDAALSAFAMRLKTIDDQIAAMRAQKMAGVPGPVSRSNAKFGGSGSGEPTRSAARIGGSAAAGAAIGAMATGGSGEAAGIGAGAGLIGGLIYDAVSKSNDKKKFEAAKERDYQERLAARNAVLRAAQNEVDAYQQQLIGAYEKELSAAADQRIQELKSAWKKS